MNAWALLMAGLCALAALRFGLQVFAAFEDWRRRRAARKAWKR